MDDLFQSLMTYILRVKFKIEFRRFNYSALIRSGQLDDTKQWKKSKKFILLKMKLLLIFV